MVSHNILWQGVSWLFYELRKGKATFYLSEKCFQLFFWCPLACIPEETVCSCFLFTMLMQLVILQTSVILSLGLKGLSIFNHSLDGSQSITFVSLGILLCTFTRFTNCLRVVDSSFLLWQFVLAFHIHPVLKGELIAPLNSQELNQVVF